MSVKVLLRATYCNLYCDSHRHSVQFEHTFRRGLRPILSRYPVHKISQLGIPKWWPICKRNSETGSRDYDFLNSESRDCNH